ncbi:MAG: molybdenum cofactor guanylyltransferase MobA [Pseudomonadota bacterium]
MTAVAAVVLAGGQARRMGGGDKCLLPLGGQPLLAHILERLSPQVGGIALNANGPAERFSDFGLPVLPDAIQGSLGPLAGVLTGLLWAKSLQPQPEWLITVPGDGPLLPRDLCARLLAAQEQEGADLACAASGGRSHPVIALWRLDLTDALKSAVEEEGLRKVDLWTGRYSLATASWQTEPCDPFFNINRPEDLAEAERLLAD